MQLTGFDCIKVNIFKNDTIDPTFLKFLNHNTIIYCTFCKNFYLQSNRNTTRKYYFLYKTENSNTLKITTVSY